MSQPSPSSGHRVLAICILLALLGSLVACSDDSSGPAPTPAAPQVVIVQPEDLASGVNPSQHIVVEFDRDLDPTQDLSLYVSLRDAVGNDLATITGVSLPAPNRLDASHTGLADGVEVHVEIGAGIRGTNGGVTDKPYRWTYWTQSSQPLFLRGVPIHESTGVPTNTQIFLLFSEPMSVSSASSQLLVQRVLPDPLGQGPWDLGFNVHAGEDGWLILDLDAPLEPGSTTRVTIPQALETEVGARTLPQTYFLSFTAADGADTTPPSLLSVVPANGSTISPDTAYIRFTFDEPVDPDSFQPSMIGAQLWLLLQYAEEGQWSQNFTVVTVPLPAPLPEGMPLRVVIQEFRDLAGNPSTEPLDYSIRVSGSADIYPFVDDLRFRFQTKRYWDEGTGEMGPEFRVSYQSLRREGPELWNRVEWNSDYSVDHNWDLLGRSSDRITLQGWVERDGGTTSTTTVDPVILWLPLPPAVQDWDGVTIATESDSSYSIEYTGELVGQEDIPLLPPGIQGPAKRSHGLWGKRAEEPQILWQDTWKQIISYALKDGETVVATGADTLWYAPAVGLVWDRSRQVDEASGGYNWTQAYLTGFEFPRYFTIQNP